MCLILQILNVTVDEIVQAPIEPTIEFDEKKGAANYILDVFSGVSDEVSVYIFLMGLQSCVISILLKSHIPIQRPYFIIVDCICIMSSVFLSQLYLFPPKNAFSSIHRYQVLTSPSLTTAQTANIIKSMRHLMLG